MCGIDTPNWEITRVNNNSASLETFIIKRKDSFLSQLIHKVEEWEKKAEIFDQGYHLFFPLINRFTSLNMSAYCASIHHLAHDIEHSLHALCIVNDGLRIYKYFKNFHSHSHDDSCASTWKEQCAKICLFVSFVFQTSSHFLATTQYLNEKGLYKPEFLQKQFKFISAFSAIGFAIGAASVCFNQGDKPYIYEKLGFYISGCAFEALSISSASSYRLKAVAGIVHCVISLRLSYLSQQEIIFTKTHDNVFVQQAF